MTAPALISCPHLTAPAVCSVCRAYAELQRHHKELAGELAWQQARAAGLDLELTRQRREEARLHAFTLALAGRLADASECLGVLAERKDRRRASA